MTMKMSEKAKERNMEHTNNPMENIMLALFGDKIFLGICILISVVAGIGVLSGGGFSVTIILYCIFLWLLYTDAKKSIVKVSNMRVISGTLFAQFVLSIIGFVCIAIGDVWLVFLAVLGAQKQGDTEFTNSAIQALKDHNFQINLGTYKLPLPSYEAIIDIMWFIAALGLLVAVGLVIEIMGYRRLHRLAKSLYKCVESKNVIVDGLGGVKSWLVIFAVYNGVLALGELCSLDIAGFLISGVNCATCILASKLIKKYISTEI